MEFSHESWGQHGPGTQGISLSSPHAGVLAGHRSELEGFASVHKKTQASVFGGKGPLASSGEAALAGSSASPAPTEIKCVTKISAHNRVLAFKYLGLVILSWIAGPSPWVLSPPFKFGSLIQRSSFVLFQRGGGETKAA